jgi:hypothetical protein
VSEEGVANIVNAFIEAGAQSVVSTLWEMEDHSTAQLMIDFYQHLSLREPKAEALRDAQLQLLKSGDPPYFWAGFELAGEPNATLFADPKSISSFRSGQLQRQLLPSRSCQSSSRLKTSATFLKTFSRLYRSGSTRPRS